MEDKINCDITLTKCDENISLDLVKVEHNSQCRNTNENNYALPNIKEGNLKIRASEYRKNCFWDLFARRFNM